MDPIDKAQQDEIDRLQEHAKEKKIIDRFQWAAIALVAAGLLLYINVVLVSMINSQASTIKNLIQLCQPTP